MVYAVKTKVQMTTIKVNLLIGNRNTHVDLCMPSRYKEVGRLGVKETVLSPVLEENTHVTPTFKCKSAGPGCSKARDSAILHRINHYPADKN